MDPSCFSLFFFWTIYFHLDVRTARAENEVLKAKVKRLEERCHLLTVENEGLKIEVEGYRKEAALPSFSKLALGQSASMDSMDIMQDDRGDDDPFVKSGNGIYASHCDVTLDQLHGMANPSCCSLSVDDSILITGGADRTITFCQWGLAMKEGSKTEDEVVNQAVRVPCSAPVICTDFARKNMRPPFVVGGCMDGSVVLIQYDTSHAGLQAKIIPSTIKHSKYVKQVAWSPTDNIFASASADGTVQVHKVLWNGMDDDIKVEKVQTLNLSGAVEALCFAHDHLCCYARGTPYLSYFDLGKDFAQTKINLNQGPGNAGFADHVSFCVLDMACKDDKFLALATDMSRNIVLDWATGKQIRNLYGHTNDGFSQPKIAWSQNGQYLLGNTQQDAHVCVWDIASSSIVDTLKGHTQPIRDMYSSSSTNSLVTTSFDKKTKIWLAPYESNV